MLKNKNHIFAIGDIHGCVNELKMLLDELPLENDSTVVFLGDYIDRGPKSKEVVETILNLKKYCHVITLMGNHEQMLIDYIKDDKSNKAANFIYNGGAATLASYCTPEGRIHFPPEHIHFFHNLLPFYENEDYFFVHAGVPEIPLKLIDVETHYQTLLWIRDKFLLSDYIWEKKIIHGHTPVVDVERKANRINLDTGCVFNHKLSAMGFPFETLYSVPKNTKTEHLFLKNLSKYEKRRAERFTGNIPVLIKLKDVTMIFETINYSDLGMQLKEKHAPHCSTFQLDDIIEGEIRANQDPQNFFIFKAVVKRVEAKENETQYGIDFIESPFESLYKILNFKNKNS